MFSKSSPKTHLFSFPLTHHVDSSKDTKNNKSSKDKSTNSDDGESGESNERHCFFHTEISKRSFKKKKKPQAEDDDDVVCQICKSGDNDDKLLLCDKCDNGFHTYCINLSTIPSGKWFCADCTLKVRCCGCLRF
jgi:hypothetical protein